MDGKAYAMDYAGRERPVFKTTTMLARIGSCRFGRAPVSPKPATTTAYRLPSRLGATADGLRISILRPTESGDLQPALRTHAAGVGGQVVVAAAAEARAMLAPVAPPE